MGAGSSTLLLEGGGTLAAQELPSKMKSLVMKPSTLTMTRAGKVWFCGKVQERIPVLEDGTLQVLGTPLMVGEPGESPLSGTFAGLTESGALQLRLADGSTRVIHAGEVRLAGPDR